MENMNFKFIVLFSTILIFVWTTSANQKPTNVLTTSTTKPPRIVSRLIHYRSVRSPFYTALSTSKKDTSWIEERSKSHLAYMKLRTFFSSKADAQAELCGGKYTSLFLADIAIGYPPVSQYVWMDTGSSLLWILCRPCDTCERIENDSPTFDPAESLTYSIISCPSPYCLPSRRRPCKPKCEFRIGYVDNTFISGYKSYETLTFTNSGKEISIHNVMFGCATNSTEMDIQSNGILGLGPDKFSLVSQLGSMKFSYCIGDIEDHEYMHNKLVIGDSSVIQGDSTPMEIYNTYYYVQLEAILVGDNRLDINKTIFRRTPSGSGGVVIDSGSALTYLTRSAYVPLKEEVRSLVDVANLQRFLHPKRTERLCYYGSIYEDLHGFPTVTFQFSGGANLVLENRSLFYSLSKRETFCMAMAASEDQRLDMNVIGVQAQQNYNIGFDLSAKTISFQMIDCELLYPDD